MDLNLALVVETAPTSCTIRWLDGNDTASADYADQVQSHRIRIRPHQLVAVDLASTPPQVVWRWFRGRVDYQVDEYAVISNHVYQAGLRAPISVARVPEVLETPITIGDEVFYSLDTDAVVIDRAEHGSPMHPERLRADLLPAIVEIYTDLRTQEA